MHLVSFKLFFLTTLGKCISGTVMPSQEHHDDSSGIPAFSYSNITASLSSPPPPPRTHKNRAIIPPAALKEYPRPTADRATRRLAGVDLAFSTEDVMMPEALAALEGRFDYHSMSGLSDHAWVLVELLTEFVKKGKNSTEIKHAFVELGYNQDYMQSTLLEKDDALEAYMELMDIVVQQEFINSIPNTHEGGDAVTDTFGNSVQGAPAHIIGNRRLHSYQGGIITDNEGNAQKKAVTKNRSFTRNQETAKQYSIRGKANAEKLRAKNQDHKQESREKANDLEEKERINNGPQARSLGSSCIQHWIGDGWCDARNNNDACSFDGGDCCESTCVDNDYACGVVGYDCKQEDCTPTTFASSSIWGGIRPGFKIRNDTPWPVEISLWQVGPLYWRIVQPGQWFAQNTGAVWFTVKATIRVDGKPSIDIWDAIWPVAVIVASVIIAVLSLGSSSAISVGATGAAVSGTTSAAIASTLVGLGIKATSALYIATTITGLGTAAGLAASVKSAAVAGGTILAREVLATDGNGLSGVKADMLSATVGGVYAGYPWPFEKETQKIVLEGGMKMEPAIIDGKCENLIHTEGISSNLRFRCIGGDCYV